MCLSISDILEKGEFFLDFLLPGLEQFDICADRIVKLLNSLRVDFDLLQVLLEIDGHLIQILRLLDRLVFHDN